LRFKNVDFTDGFQELKVFVDLEHTSTREYKIEIAKVTCLQLAANGYAPLIFNYSNYGLNSAYQMNW
jgi:hypothetical protein